MIYRHVWPGEDPRAETMASFRVAMAMVPRRVKRSFGYDEPAADELDEEIERLLGYTRW